MKSLKHITAFVFITALFLPLITPVLLQLQQRYVQWEMMEELEEKELVTISVDEASIQWIEKGKECMIAGEMFDIKKLEQQASKLTLTGLFDAKEQQIKASITKQSKQQQNNQSKQLVKLLLMVATPLNESSTDFYLTATLSSKQLYKSSYYISPFTGNLTPPPKFI